MCVCGVGVGDTGGADVGPVFVVHKINNTWR
jgi:hypothetical protein